MEYLKRFYDLSGIVQKLSNMSFNVVDSLSNNLSNMSLQNYLKKENNDINFIDNFDFVNNILFLDEELENRYKIFFQHHLHCISNELEESIYSNHLSVLITYYNLLIRLINENNLQLYKSNLPFETFKDILKYIETLNDNVLFDCNDKTYNDLDLTRKTMIPKIEYLVLLLIDKLRNFNGEYQLKEYQDITRIYFNTIQMIVYVLLYN